MFRLHFKSRYYFVLSFFLFLFILFSFIYFFIFFLKFLSLFFKQLHVPLTFWEIILS